VTRLRRLAGAVAPLGVALALAGCASEPNAPSATSGEGSDVAATPATAASAPPGAPQLQIDAPAPLRSSPVPEAPVA